MQGIVQKLSGILKASSAPLATFLACASPVSSTQAFSAARHPHPFLRRGTHAKVSSSQRTPTTKSASWRSRLSRRMCMRDLQMTTSRARLAVKVPAQSPGVQSTVATATSRTFRVGRRYICLFTSKARSSAWEICTFRKAMVRTSLPSQFHNGTSITPLTPALQARSRSAVPSKWPVLSQSSSPS